MAIEEQDQNREILYGEVQKLLSDLAAQVPIMARRETSYDVDLPRISTIDTSEFPNVGDSSGKIMDDFKSETISLINEIQAALEVHKGDISVEVLERFKQILIAPSTPNVIDDKFFVKNDPEFTLAYNLELRDKIINLFFRKKFYNLNYINQQSGTNLTWEQFGKILTLLQFDITQFTLETNEEKMKELIGNDVKILEEYLEAIGIPLDLAIGLLTNLNTMGNDANIIANMLSFDYAKDLYMNYFVNLADRCNYALVVMFSA